MMKSQVSEWCEEDVCKWLDENGFNDWVGIFSSHRIDGLALMNLTEHDLWEILKIYPLGVSKRLFVLIHQLKVRNASWFESFGLQNQNENVVVFEKQSYRTPEKSNFFAKSLEPEYFKCFLGFCYVFLVFLLTSFVMVVVHHRVPDMKKYPPLPDFALDNIPYIPWAFDICEACIETLCTIWITTLVFHKHRFILMRRWFSLTGSIFLLRCLTMFVTSLSVPSAHLECEPQKYHSLQEKFERAFEIWYKLGMASHGVRTCGDYMFSGHTAMATSLNFFITEYTPLDMYWLHTTTWVINIFALFFILAAHEHYAIDVLIGFYITSRLFLYYHSLANNSALMQSDRKRTMIWFPLFSFFESKVDGIVPNEYEWPFSSYFVKKSDTQTAGISSGDKIKTR